MACLLVSNLSKYFGDELLFSDISFEVADNDRIGLVGVNGTGKTSLFKILTGEYSYDSGEISLGRDVSVGYMEQHVCKDLDVTVYDEVLKVFSSLIADEEQLEVLRIRMNHVSGEALEELIEQQTALRENFERNGGLTFRSRARSALLGLGFTENQLSLRVGVLSGGQKAKLQLAKMLLGKSNLLLLDEPTNHLDIASIEWLEDFLKSYTGAFLVISHDRYFLDKLTNRTFEIENRHLTAYNGNYTRFLALKQEALVSAQRHYSNVRKEINRIEGIIEQQKQWNRERNYRIIDSKKKIIDRLEDGLVAPESEPESLNFQFTIKNTSGNDVLMLNNLSLQFDNNPLFKNVDVLIRRKERVFLLGPNGCGKTSLFKLILGEYTAQTGSVRFGSGVSVGYYDQVQQGLSYDKTVIDELWDAWPQLTQTEIRSALASFLFKGEDVFKNVSSLSGGERARLLLLKLMMSRDNFLLLDEPTNHLDIHSREALEAALESYDGTLFVISHDRYLINKMADRIYSLEDASLVSYDGNYDSYIERKKSLESASAQSVKTSNDKGNEYRLQKQQGAQLRKKQNRLRKLEEEIAEIEQQSQAVEEMFSLPEYAADYEKMIELTKQNELVKEQIENLYAEWMELNEELNS